MNLPNLAPDCPNCAALCCILLPFDKGTAFGFDKPAGVICRHLGSDRRCTIHDHLSEQGFSGCSAFSCLGAGQRITQSLIKGADWLGQPERHGEIDVAFRAMRRIHEALAMLLAAGKLPLPARHEADRQDLMARLDAGRDWTPDSLSKATGATGILTEVRSYLLGLGALDGIKPPHR